MTSLELHKINKNKTRENGHLRLDQRIEGLRKWLDGRNGSQDWTSPEGIILGEDFEIQRVKHRLTDKELQGKGLVWT